jgi:hypothetical protein
MTTNVPLPDIDDIDPFSEADRECLTEVRSVLEKHGSLQRFGLTLLHQHFELAEDEVLVEEIDVDNRILTSRPKRITECENAVETAWRLDDQTVMARCQQVCERPTFTMARHAKKHYR